LLAENSIALIETNEKPVQARTSMRLFLMACWLGFVASGRAACSAGGDPQAWACVQQLWVPWLEPGLWHLMG